MPKEYKIGGIWFTLLLSLLSLYLIFQVVVKVPLRESLTGLNPFFIGVGFLALFLIWLSKAYRMYSIGIGMGFKVKLFFYFQMYLATCFISHVTPFNSGGTPLQIYLLHKKGVTLGKAAALTVVDLGLNTAMFMILVPAALLTNIGRLKNFRWHGSNFLSYFWLMGVALFGIVLWLVFRYSGVWARLKSWSWVLKIYRYFKGKEWRKHLMHEWALFKEGWLLLVHDNPVSIIRAVGATVVYWFFYLLLAPLVLWSMGKPVSFESTIGLQLLFNFGQIFIPTPGGSGGSELLLLYMFKPLTGHARAGTFVLLWKMYTFFSTLIAGGFFFWRLTGKRLHKKA